MASSILNVGKSALNAAQAGLLTTGHNIANASSPGYSRQVVKQQAAQAQDMGVGFIGKGTEISTVERVFNEFLHNQVLNSQTAKNSLDGYYAQIKQIDNLLADPSAGLSPALQDFFKGVQDLAANPNAAASRQAMLSSAEALAARFQGLAGRLNELSEGVNNQITASVDVINTYATQIAQLNDQIEKAQGSSGADKPANDLLDQRDQVISDLSKEVKVSVVKQNNTYNVFIGNGQPLVVGTKPFDLVATVSPNDLSRTQVGVQSNGVLSVLPEGSLPGGKIGGLFDFRAKTLDTAQNALGRVAAGLAFNVNAQHQLGQDQDGIMGGNLFTLAAPVVNAHSGNNAGTAAVVGATITDASRLTTSNYRLQYDGTNYTVTRLSDHTQLYSNAAFPAGPNVIEGVTLNLTSGAFSAGDEFLIKPTSAGASGLNVAINDIARIAAAAPIRTAAPVSNNGSGKISAGTVDATFTTATVTPAVTLTYNSGANTLTGFPATLPVTVTNGTTTTTFAAGLPVTYTAGATISFGGVSVVMTGTPSNGDTFSIGRNTNGQGDSRNAVLMGALQTANTLGNTNGVNTMSFQGAYAQLVSVVGNKTRELEVTSSAESKMLDQAMAAHQAESGVNLDEEATNLLRYQQAYMAAGKVMQAAKEMFDLLLNLGG